VAVATEDKEDYKPNPIAQFFRDAFSEMRKVVWPSREETQRLTLVVIGISLLVGSILAVFDLLFETLVRIIQ